MNGDKSRGLKGYFVSCLPSGSVHRTCKPSNYFVTSGHVNIGFKTLEEGQEDPAMARTSLINLKNENKK